MPKIPGYTFFITVILDKFLLKLGYIGEPQNMNVYAKERLTTLSRFFIDVFLSGLMIHLSFFWVYLILYNFLGTRLHWGVHVPLILSYGLFYHFFLNWLPKPKNIGVSFNERRK